MTISGTQLAKELKNAVAAQVAEVKEKYGRAPHLVVILVGEDPASQSYVKGKGRDAEEVGFKSTTIRRPADITEEEHDMGSSCNSDNTLWGRNHKTRKHPDTP